jgi:hypothetical protein
MVRHPVCSVFDCWVEHDWFVDFCRALSSEEFQRWTLLYDELQHISLDEFVNDKVIWALEKSKTFTTKSLYRFLTNRGMPSKVAGFIWKCKIQLKINFFLWQTFNNRLPVGQSLIRRGWKGNDKCCVWGVLESIDHILFDCVLARMIWAILKEAFDLESVPRSLKSFSEDWLQGKGPLPSRLLMFLFAGFSWTLCVTRNKMAIERSYPKTPSDVLYAALSLLQKWIMLLKEGDKRRMSQVKDTVICWMRRFKPSPVMPTGIYEI